MDFLTYMFDNLTKIKKYFVWIIFWVMFAQIKF